MGILRFLLAVAVIASHTGFIGFPIFNGNASWAALFVSGTEAVCFFYIISGFYMAMVLNTKYKFNTKQFYLNRFLRLWPAYVVTLILSVIFLNTFNEIVALSANCSFLGKAYIWFSNLFILGTDTFWLVGLDVVTGHFKYFPSYINESSNGYALSMITPSFSVAIEMIFYLIAPFILKSIKRTWLFLIIGALYYYGILYTENLNIIFQYHFFPSSFVFFAIGALSWHYFIDKNITLQENKNFLILFLILIVLIFCRMLLPTIEVMCIAFSIPLIFNFSKNSKLDRFIGELSYPMYILHFPVRIYLQPMGINPSWFGIAVLLFTLFLAIPIHLLVEKPIDKYRHRLLTLTNSN